MKIPERSYYSSLQNLVLHIHALVFTLLYLGMYLGTSRMINIISYLVYSKRHEQCTGTYSISYYR
eukprot:SAG11_NODE_3811_length_2212_cov_0.942735_1_plen_65_part_00